MSHHHDQHSGRKTVVAGATTIAFEACIGHPLEFLKIAKQTSSNTGYAQLLRGITASKGWRGLWDGFLPWGVVQAGAKGAVFGGAQVLAQRALTPLERRGWCSSETVRILSGGISGGVQGLVLSPCLLLKTRVMTDPAFRAKEVGSSESFRIGMRVIQREGPMALMKGSGVFSLKRVADWTSRYYFAEMSERVLFGGSAFEMQQWQRVTASLCGGVLSTLATIPIDVLVAQIQQASRAGSKYGIWAELSKQISSGGLLQLVRFSTQGFVPRVWHVALTTALLRSVTDIVYNWTFSDKKRQHS